MDASLRVSDEFDRLVALGRAQIPGQSFAHRTLFYVVVARCEKDMAGFCSVYEQAFDAREMAMLIEGLNGFGEEKLAEEFALGFQLLSACGFYRHRNWNEVSPEIEDQIEGIGERIGTTLWGLDEKLIALLDRSTVS